MFLVDCNARIVSDLARLFAWLVVSLRSQRYAVATSSILDPHENPSRSHSRSGPYSPPGRPSRAWRVLVAGAIALAALAPAARAAPPPTPKPKATAKTELPTRIIAIAINGEDLAAEPAPRVVGGRLLVPIVRIYGALGIAVSRDGDDVVAAAPRKTIRLHLGSSYATIDNARVQMDGPAVEIDGATYVPLRFVADSLGAGVSYDAKAARVDVISSLIGRTPSLMQSADGGRTQIVGTVTAVDLNSEPESITVSRSGSVRSIAINSDAKIVLQDTVAKTTSDATLADVRAGDAVSVFLTKDGKVDQLIDRYASRTGVVAAVSPSAIVLRDGHVIAPDRATVITLNGVPANIGDAQVGDTMVVRSNPDTGEKRQILISRAMPVTPQPAAGAVAISAFTVDATNALRAGDKFTVTLTGTPGGKASFDIGAYVEDIPLQEAPPGTYRAEYTIPPNVNFGQVAVYGHLDVNGTSAPRVAAPALIAVSTTPPAITDFAPPAGQTVNNPTPSIFATFSSPTNVGINASTVTINVNGLDVTASSYRTGGFITYSPTVPLRDGTVNVRVAVSDVAGNRAERAWTFTVRSH
jgi:hypothetical protein